jgi:hypothetical protein
VSASAERAIVCANQLTALIACRQALLPRRT